MGTTAFGAYAYADVGSPSRERLEDYALQDKLTTAGGLELQLAMVCDGVGIAQFGIAAARTTAKRVVENIKKSIETDIPTLLTEAIREANQYVFQTILEGYTTISLMVVDLTDNMPYGRLFIASVGDSPVFLVRDGQLARLNTDHNLATDMIFRGEIQRGQEHLVEGNPYALTRAIGIHDDVDVDVGFYLGGASPEQAEARGIKGLKLQDGDTLIATSDGLVDDNPEDGLPYVHDDEFLRHAVDEDAERAGKFLISYAIQRIPSDNVSIALMFAPGKNRKAVAGMDRALSARTRTRLIIGVVIVLLIIGTLIVLLINQSG